jgi:hypothetical protein
MIVKWQSRDLEIAIRDRMRRPRLSVAATTCGATDRRGHGCNRVVRRIASELAARDANAPTDRASPARAARDTAATAAGPWRPLRLRAACAR